jgi:DNA repair exonuclease SbcCD ATPase subunit
VKATDIRKKFQEWIGKLRDEAKERSGTATELHGKLEQFQKDLRQSASDFGMHVKKYKEEYGTASTEIDRIKQEIQGLDDELAAATKKHHDETIVLSTAPLYLLIPFFGPLIMAGVLIGVGVDFGLLVERIKGQVEKLEQTRKRLSVKQAFYEQYRNGAELTQKTADDLAVVLPLVKKLEGAWRTMTSDLDDLHKVLVGGAVESVKEDWDYASLDLDTARATWNDLKDQADRYRRFAEVKAASNVTELSSGVRPAA